MSSWRVAPAIVALQRTLDLARPGRRARHPDGTIGDAAHSARKSDHNPDDDGLVCAIDVHDSDVLDDASLYEAIKAAGTRNPVKYAISEGRIWSPERGERPYTGPNPHNDHVHVSVTQAGKRLAADWVLPGITTQPKHAKPDEEDDVTPQDIEKVAQRVVELMKPHVASRADMRTLLRGGPTHPHNLTTISERINKILGKM